MTDLIDVLKNPIFSATLPPSANVRQALGLRANSELQNKWAAYLDEAEEVLMICLPPQGTPPLPQHSSRHGPLHTQHTASTAATPRYPQGRR